MNETGDTIYVLHVDDDPNFVDLVSTFLERENGRISVRTATSPEDGLRLLADHTVDCIVSDYDMSHTNGLEFLHTVRTNEPDLPFILFTGKGSEEIASRAISAGVTDYLQKGGPETYTLLANRVTRAVREYRAQKFETTAKQKPLTLLGRISDAFLVLNTDWQFTFVNEAAEEIFDAPASDLVGREIWEVFPEATETPFFDHYHRAMDEGESRTIVEYFEPWDRWYRERLYPSEDGLSVLFQDITEQKKREQELARVRDLLDRTERIAGVGGWEIDTETMDVFWTENLFDLLRVDYDEEPPLEDALDIYHEDDRPIVENAVETALDSGEPFDVEVRFLTPDNEVRWLRVQGDPAVDDGETVSLRGAVQDITVRKERELELERERNRFETIFEVSNDAILILDLDNDTVVDANPQAGELLGYSREELVSSVAISDVHPGDMEQYRVFLDRVREQDLGRRAEFQCVTKAGEPRDCEISVSSTEFDESRYLIASVRDVSDRKRREQELQRQNDRLEEFVSVVSHDLRNPLTVAEAQLKLAQEECDSGHLDAIRRTHERIDALIADLLTLAWEGAAGTDVTSVDLANLSERCWQNVDTRGATLVVDVDRTVRADERRLRQLFENLFRNCVEHGSTGSRPKADDSVEHGGADVTVTVGELDGGFYVEDDGPGIPEDDRAEVFEAGYTTSDRGTGFGLAIVKRVVDAHGWTISVTEGTAGGARFEITGVESVTE